MGKMVYEWGRRPYKVPAQEVGAVIEQIAEAEGKCTPQALIEAAAPEDSPVHSLFTWDDTKAAANWRTHEARNVINSITVRVVREGGDMPAPAFVSVGHVKATQGMGEGYRPLSVVLEDPAMAEEAVWQAIMQLRAVERRYKSLKQLAPVWDAVEKVEAENPKKAGRAA